MSATTSEHDDLSATQEYTIAGLVILLFGFLYLLFNYGMPTFSFNSVDAPAKTLAVTEDPVASTAAIPLTTRPAALQDAGNDLETNVTTNNNRQAEVTQNLAQSSADPTTNTAGKGQQLAVTTEDKPSTDQQQVAITEPPETEQQGKAEIAANTNQLDNQAENQSGNQTTNQPEANVAATKSNDMQSAETKSTNGGLVIMDAAVAKLQDYLKADELDKPVLIESISFADKSFDINLTSDHQLDGIAALLKQHPDSKILIRGHASADEGSGDVSKELSLDRANTTGERLVKAGVKPGNIILMGMGSLEPLPGNTQQEKNRRIDISITQPRPAVDRPKE